MADTNRRLDAIEDRQNRQEAQIRLINELGQATRSVIQAYLNVSASLQLAYVPFKGAYDEMIGAMRAHTARLEAMRMAFIDLFFVGLGGWAGGLVQHTVREMGPKDALRYIAAGTAAGDIAKYMVRLIPGNNVRAPDAQPTRQQSHDPPPDRQPANPQTRPAPGGAPQPAGTQQPGDQQPGQQAGGQQASSDPLSSNLDPNSWLQTTLGHLGISTANVSAQLSELAGRVTSGMVAPDGESPVAVVSRLLVPIHQLKLEVRQQRDYARVLWGRWLSEVWLEDATRYRDHNQVIERLQAQDRSLLRDIEAQCGSRDLIQAALERGRARTAANRRRNHPTLEDLERQRATPRR